MGAGSRGRDKQWGGAMSECSAPRSSSAFVALYKEKNIYSTELFNQHIYF